MVLLIDVMLRDHLAEHGSAIPNKLTMGTEIASKLKIQVAWPPLHLRSSRSFFGSFSLRFSHF